MEILMVTRSSASVSKSAPKSASMPASKTKPAVKASPRAKPQTPSPSQVQPRKYDVVLYGASGFVGKQTVAYFAQLGHLKPAAGKPLRWALAGRSASKLASVKAACGAGAKNADIVVADAQDSAALGQLAQDACVVLVSSSFLIETNYRKIDASIFLRKCVYGTATSSRSGIAIWNWYVKPK